jgi:voltage-gated potassium channel
LVRLLSRGTCWAVGGDRERKLTVSPSTVTVWGIEPSTQSAVMSDQAPEESTQPDAGPTGSVPATGGRGASDGMALNWTIGFSCALASLVAGFLPWLTMSTEVAGLSGKLETDGLIHLMGVHFDYGQMALIGSLVAVTGWLVQRRVLAFVGGTVAGGVGAWLLFVWGAQFGEQAHTEWGLVAFVGSAALSVLFVLVSGRRVGTLEGRQAIRSWVNRKLNPGDNDSKAVDTFIITLIAFNVLSVIVETEQPVADAYSTFFLVNETVSTLVFSIEYVLRVWICTMLPAFASRGPLGARVRYALSMMALVDFIAIAPFFLSFIQMDLRIARAIRLMRLVRILKMGRYAHAVKTLGNVIARKKEELAIATFVTVMVLILSASAMYFAEHLAQPEAFRSIPESMWWAVVTITSVGYGDVSPVTGIGKVLGAVICMIGVLIVALPTGILASGFLEEMREQRRGKDADVFGFCPHCGKQLMPDEELD